jgi:hypothetical protein
MYCNNCGNEITEGNSICYNCGEQVWDIPVISSDSNRYDIYSDGITSEELGLFVGNKRYKYCNEKWSKFKKPGNSSSIGWNWSALFCATLWLMYRKMYLYGIGIWILLGVITQLPPDQYTLPLNIAVSLLLALFSDKLYYEHSKRKIIAIKNNSKYSNKQQVISKKGGTSLGVLIICIIIYLGSISAIVIAAFSNQAYLNKYGSNMFFKASSSATDIKSTSDKFLTAFLGNDFKGTMEYSFLENSDEQKNKEYFDSLSRTIATATNLDQQSNGQAYNLYYKVENIQIIDKEKALVKYSLRSDVQKEARMYNMDLVKKDGVWKVNFLTFGTSFMGIS